MTVNPEHILKNMQVTKQNIAGNYLAILRQSIRF